jgi:hypothetical protein
MKRIDQMQNSLGQYFNTPVLQRSITPVSRSRAQPARRNFWSVGFKLRWPAKSGERSTDHFRGLSLELFAGSVMNNETVLPKAVKTAGLMMPRLNWGYASDASPRRAATISLERRVVSKQ